MGNETHVKDCRLETKKLDYEKQNVQSGGEGLNADKKPTKVAKDMCGRSKSNKAS